MRLLTIHHLAATGGSVICKAINSMNNTLVVSETHPNVLQYKFNPFDPTQILLHQPKLKNNLELRKSIYVNRIKDCYSIAEQINCNLVLRDHAHSDYMQTKNIESIKNKCSLLEALPKYFEVRSILSIRDPIESFISSQLKGWINNITNFDDYCRRYELMVETYFARGAKIVRYEDFCKNPNDTLRTICNFFDISFNENFEEIFYEIPMTGNSGRGKTLDHIRTLEPKVVGVKLKDEALSSNSYIRLSNRFNYGAGIFN